MVDREDYFCEKCHSEFIIDLHLHEDVTEGDIKFCPFCGHEYDSEQLNLDETNFSDEFGEYEE